MCLRLGTARQCILLDTESMPLVLQGAETGDGALMPNAGGTGYYRFELPRADWDRLIAASAHLSSGEGLALADSLTASFMAGRADAGQMAELARVMTANPDSYASSAALGGLEMLDTAGMLDSPATAAYHRLVGHLYEAQLAQYGFDPGARAYPGEAAERSQRRVQLIGRLSDIARDPGVRRKLADAAAAWMGGNADALDPVWYGNGFTVWLDDGKAPASTLDRAHRLMDKALASQDALLRPAALHALAHSGHLDVATWLLNGTADPRLRLSERLQLIAGVAATPMTRELGYNYMRDHLDTLLTAGGGIFFRRDWRRCWLVFVRWKRPPPSLAISAPGWRARPASSNWTGPWNGCATAACCARRAGPKPRHRSPGCRKFSFLPVSGRNARSTLWASSAKRLIRPSRHRRHSD